MVGNGIVFLGDEVEVVAVGAVPKTSSGPSSGVIAAAVICSLLGVAAIGAAVWYFRLRAAGGSCSLHNPFKAAPKYTTLIGSSAAMPAHDPYAPAHTSSGAYGTI